jgi:hypothetical protein
MTTDVDERTVARLAAAVSMQKQIGKRDKHHYTKLAGHVLCVVIHLNLQHIRARWLVRLVVEGSHVRVSQGLVRRDALVRIEIHALLDEIQRLRGRSREEGIQRFLADGCHTVNHGGGKWRFDGRDVVSRWLACQLQHTLQLVHSGVTWKDGAAHNHLTKDAAHSPHVDSLCVSSGPQQNLGCCTHPEDEINTRTGG